MERMVSNAIIQCFFTLLVDAVKGELKWMHVCMTSVKFLTRSQKCQRFTPRGVLPKYSQTRSEFRNRASLVDVVAALRFGRPRDRSSISWKKKEFVFSPNSPDRS